MIILGYVGPAGDLGLNTGDSEYFFEFVYMPMTETFKGVANFRSLSGRVLYALPVPSFLGRLGLHPLEIEARELSDQAIDNYFVCLSHPGMGSLNLDSCS